jgi:hypothetical protein
MVESKSDKSFPKEFIIQRRRLTIMPVIFNPFGVFSIKYVRDLNISPRCLTLKQAATYVGLTPRSYREAVRQNKYPDIIPGTRRYDRNAIDARLNAASGVTQHQDIAKPKFSPYDDWFGNEG